MESPLPNLGEDFCLIRPEAPERCPPKQSPRRESRAVLPRSSSAFLISFTMRICSINRPERSPESPALAPATERSWQGLPPQTISTGVSSAPFSFVMSPTWTMSGNRSFVTSMGKASISLAHTGVMPLCTAARGKPPIPSNRLPIVVTSFVSLVSMLARKLTRSAVPPLPTQPTSLGFP